MIICTSIAPSHNANSQLQAVESWHKLGLSIYSFNSQAEAQELCKHYPNYVKFIPVKRTAEFHFGKPYVYINSMMDYFTENQLGDVCCIMNSDIILKYLPEKIKDKCNEGIVISNRTDFLGEIDKMQNIKKFVSGFDIFFIHKKFISIYPQSVFVMGQCVWDYWIPFHALKNNIPVFRVAENFAFHKVHPIQYNTLEWRRMVAFFMLENKIMHQAEQVVSNQVWEYIMTNSKEI